MSGDDSEGAPSPYRRFLASTETAASHLKRERLVEALEEFLEGVADRRRQVQREVVRVQGTSRYLVRQPVLSRAKVRRASRGKS